MIVDRVRRLYSRKRAEKVRALLPWYVSGSLSPTEMRLVENWL